MTVGRAVLPPGELEALFPFHLVFGADLQIRQLGPRLARVLPGLREGEALLAHFEVVRPRLRPVTLASMAKQSKSVFLLRARSKPLDLRGQLVCVEDGAAAFFLGSPWVTRSEQLVALGLDFTDFAVHDALADALVLMRAQQRSIEESEKLAAELAAQRSELSSFALSPQSSVVSGMFAEPCWADSSSPSLNSSARFMFRPTIAMSTSSRC